MISSDTRGMPRPGGHRLFPSRRLPSVPGCAWVRTRATVLGPAPHVRALASDAIGVAARVWLVGEQRFLGGLTSAVMDVQVEAGAAWVGDEIELSVDQAVVRVPLTGVRLDLRAGDLDLYPLELPLAPPLDRLIPEASERMGRLSFCERLLRIGDALVLHGVLERVDPRLGTAYRASERPGERFVARPDLGPCTLRLARRARG